MLDKIGILFLILFVISGVAVYDRYVTAHGEIGPVARMLDYTGFSKFFQPHSDETQTKITTKSVSTGFEELQAKIAQIQKKRAQMVARRQEILAQLSSLNGHIKEDAGQLLKALESERTIMNSHTAEINSGAAEMENAVYSGNPTGTTVVLSSIESENPAGEIRNLLKRMEVEHNIFSENSLATEKQFQTGLETTSGQARELIQKLTQASDQDLTELMKLYKELEAIQIIMSDNLVLNFARLQGVYKEAELKQKQAIAQLKLDPNGVSASDIVRYEGLVNDQMLLLSSLDTAEKELRNKWQDVWVEYRKFFNYQQDLAALNSSKTKDRIGHVRRTQVDGNGIELSENEYDRVTDDPNSKYPKTRVKSSDGGQADKKVGSGKNLESLIRPTQYRSQDAQGTLDLKRVRTDVMAR